MNPSPDASKPDKFTDVSNPFLTPEQYEQLQKNAPDVGSGDDKGDYEPEESEDKQPKEQT